MLYFWHSTNDREKVSEVYLNEIAVMPGLSKAYNHDFDQESVRKVLSAITNRERISGMTKTEGRFWNNNMWMMDDLSYTDAMSRPVKKLNLDDFIGIINQDANGCKYEEIEVRFSPLSTKDNMPQIADAKGELCFTLLNDDMEIQTFEHDIVVIDTDECMINQRIKSSSEQLVFMNSKVNILFEELQNVKKYEKSILYISQIIKYIEHAKGEVCKFNFTREEEQKYLNDV